MNRIRVRPLRVYDEVDKSAFIQAVDASGKEFPRDVFSLPSTRVMVASQIVNGAENIVMYQPHFTSLTLGSLVPVTCKDVEMAEAQRELVAAAYTRAHSEGFATLLAFSNNIKTRQFALRHGFTEQPDGLRMELR